MKRSAQERLFQIRTRKLCFLIIRPIPLNSFDKNTQENNNLVLSISGYQALNTSLSEGPGEHQSGGASPVWMEYSRSGSAFSSSLKRQSPPITLGGKKKKRSSGKVQSAAAWLENAFSPFPEEPQGLETLACEATQDFVINQTVSSNNT